VSRAFSRIVGVLLEALFVASHVGARGEDTGGDREVFRRETRRSLETPVAKLVICLASPPATARRKTCDLSSTREAEEVQIAAVGGPAGVSFDRARQK